MGEGWECSSAYNDSVVKTMAELWDVDEGDAILWELLIYKEEKVRIRRDPVVTDQQRGHSLEIDALSSGRLCQRPEVDMSCTSCHL